MTQNPTPQQIKKARFIPYLFVIFFGVIFAVDLTYIYVANKSWRGLATENGYQKGLKYNQTIEYSRKQKSLGWSAKIKYENLTQKSGILEVALFDKNGAAINDAAVKAVLTRPVQEGFDFEIKLPAKNSRYISEITFPLKGQWNVEIQAVRGDQNFQDSKRFVIQ
jgi:nitrogen fixation protein FixH